MKASDISDGEMLSAIKVVAPWRGAQDWADRAALAEYMPYPPKVILAKARSMIRRGLILGCACGCRGDFRLES